MGLSKKKKKKRKKKKKKGVMKADMDKVEGEAVTDVKGDAPTAEEAEAKTNSAEGGVGHNYDYADMLNHAFVMMQKRNPDYGKTKRYVMKPPMVCRIGSKRSSWMNFMEICGFSRESRTMSSPSTSVSLVQ